ncbi:MAG: tRNA (N(6)-L-threonylcarbamoyladenosine(37)-C(2))-methylthiotransferase MtaB [Bacilli bacterium]|nr:tRNA (N(6)-L-threonylcarbamoyladenosine(37)-C(2))-methylthiotransferase MtaB [Bacilli bacterium]
MKFKVFSLGCKVNSYECSALSSALIKRGYVQDNSSPDIVIINTCSVTATADQKSRQHIRKFIKMYPKAISVVMGCYSQGNYEYIAREINPNIIVGTSSRDKIPDLIERYIATKENIVLVEKDTRKYKYEELGITSYTENVRAYLKIQDGCDNFCTYCLIPYRRGKMRSRELNNIVEEAKYLVGQGYKEIILTGIHVGGYGRDIDGVSFTDLVEQLSNIENLSSLRISSIEASEIDSRLISLIKERDNIAKHLHIPLQAGSNEILRRMNRKYTSEEFVEKIKKIRKEIPDVGITTDIIVGFPGETEENFLDTLKVARECFDQIHVFPYSAREGTPAVTFPNQISPQVKSERVERLMSLSNELHQSFKEKMVGKTMNALIEKYDSKLDINYGKLTNYVEISIKGLQSNQVGKVISVKIDKSMIESN